MRFFTRKVFNTLVPGSSYCANWHLDSMGHYLTRIHKRESRRLVINVPPRHLKTIYASISFPAWVVGHNPGCRIIFATYSMERAAEVHRQFRAVIESSWYQDLFPAMRATKQTETELITTAGGGLLATSVGGPLTGYGADLIIIDDPTKAEGPGQDVARKRANAWFSGSVVTRLNDQKTGAIVVVQQRLHARDLSGHVLAKGECDHLNLPAIATADVDIPIGPGKVFTRRKGDPLHPARMGWTEIHDIARFMEPAQFAAQYQQEPVLEDRIVVRSWVKFYDRPPARRAGDRVVQSWDTAYTAGGDFSVCVTAVVRHSEIYVLNVFRDRLLYPDLRGKIAYLAVQHGADVVLLENFGAGADLIADLRRDQPAGMPRLVGQQPVGTKVARLKAQVGKIAGGRLYLPTHADWAEPFIEELVGFPDDPHDDQVDALSQLLKYAGRLDDPTRGIELNVISIPNDNPPPWTPRGHRMGRPGW